MKNFFLHVIVFAGGAAVLALEIAGTRILGPFYGVSLFLWSALISVTLAALSLGYMLGGRWADKKATLPRLCAMLMIAGIWIMLIPWMKRPFLSLAEPLGLRFAVLLAAFVLFFVPLMLLGTVTPFAVKLKTTSLDKLGRTAGNLYAISTLASVLSALVTGFYLIPNVGVTNLILIIGGLLLLIAVIGFFTNKQSMAAGAGAITVITLFTLTAWMHPGDKPDPAHGLLAIEQSPYAELRVLDTDNGRYLLIDGAIHALVDTATWESSLHYAGVMDLPQYFFDKPGRMLVIGLGGGSLVKNYAKFGWKVDAVEIDLTVINLAREYFNLKPSEGNIIEMDGRQFLSSTREKYDVILLDAFGSSSIPFHLVTKEVFALISSRLNPGGLFALNVSTVGWNDPIIKSLCATLKQAFNDVLALPMEEPPGKFGNIAILASNNKLEPSREPERNDIFDPAWRYGPGYQKVHAWDNRFMPNIEKAQIFTDDLNPVDIRAEAINLASRKGLHEYFGRAGMAW